MSADPKELAAEYDLDRRAAENLVAYLREQQAATRVVPSDETVVVERFRDEIGDWRLCVLSPWGGRVHAAWGLALSARIRDEHDLEADAIWSDDGIVVHLPDADEPPPADLVLLEADEVEDLVVRELGGSALFGARFRENAARALLAPARLSRASARRCGSSGSRRRACSRSPRTSRASRSCSRPTASACATSSTCRASSRFCATSARGAISLVEVETPTASPFASSLLFDYVATYMYEGDTPNAERRAAALSLDRELLRELLGQEELRELIDPEALAEVEDSLQHRTEVARAKDRDALQQILRRLGDLTSAECEERVAEGYSADSMLEKLERERRAARVRIAGEERWIAAEDAGLYRDALGVPPPAGPAGDVPRRGAGRDGGPGSPLRAHPRPVPHRAARRAATGSTPRRRCASWSGRASWSAASCCPGAPSASGAIRTCCAGCGGRASPTCAPRPRRSTRASWRASCRAGRTSTPTGPRGPAPIGCARRWSRSRASR